MNKPKLFVCEKPQQAKAITELMIKNDIVILAQSISAYQFDYQEIKFKDAPYTRETPKYKKNTKYENDMFNIGNFDHSGNYSKCPVLIKINTLSKYSENIKNYFNQFSEVIYVCDYDLSGYRGFSFRMNYFFKLGEDWINFFDNEKIKLTAIKLESFSQEILKNSYNARQPIKNNKDMEELKNNYIKKDYFEYNYNLNSMLFFSQALKESGYIKTKNDFLLTKNYIWVICELNKNKLKECELINKMENSYIANSASRDTLLHNLELMNLIENNTYIQLTLLGKRFFEKLHKKVNDPFIGLRLVQNNFKDIQIMRGKEREKANNLSINNFKYKYEQYLYNTFSKQKRFLRK